MLTKVHRLEVPREERDSDHYLWICPKYALANPVILRSRSVLLIHPVVSPSSKSPAIPLSGTA